MKGHKKAAKRNTVPQVKMMETRDIEIMRPSELPSF